MTDFEMFRAWMAQAGVEGVETGDDGLCKGFAFGSEAAHHNGTSPAKIGGFGCVFVCFDTEGNLSEISSED